MEFWQSFKIALRALRVNKMRSFLTMLGIIIGIASVIAMVAIGTGAQKMISEQIASMGSNLILIIPGSTTTAGVRFGSGGSPTLTYDDARAIKAECPAVEEAAPTTRGGGQVVYANQNWSTVVMGITPEFVAVREWPVAEGRNFSQSDIDGMTKNCIIGQTIADNLFGSMDPVGKVIRIKNVPFTVVGLLERKGQSPQGTDQDDAVYIPIRTAQRKLFGSSFPNAVNSVLIRAVSSDDLARVEEQVTALLKQRHHIGPNKENDFTVRNLTELLSVASSSSQTMSILLGAVASISLIVGGIGIMNIMLVSVTERTREIGIRMAIGARQRDILLQFLTEAVLLTFFGGVIGIAIGVGGAIAVSSLVGWPTLVSFEAIILAVVFSAAVGIFFGFYPAKKAADLNPIDALRYE